ncbi:MAG: inositol monophosphatase family protein [Micromonosporaceae bacterium]
MTAYANLLPVAVEAVELARGLVRGRAPGVLTSKGDRDMASQLDFAVEQAVRDFLGRATPGIGLIGEEQGATGPDSELRWVLDPIDGTVNLVHGLPLFAVSLALVHSEHPVLGVIDLPLLDSRYTAVEGHGTHVDGQLIQVSDTAHLIDAIVTIGDYAVGAGAQQKNELRLAVTTLLAGQVQRVRMFGTAAVDLAWLAHGRTDAMVVLSNNQWDMAAGVIVAREAGAVVVDLDGSPYTFGSRATIAANPYLIDQVLGLVEECQAGAEGDEAGGERTTQPGQDARP